MRRDEEWLGTREKLEDGSFDDHYHWQTWGEVSEKVDALAKGIQVLNLSPVLENIKEDGKSWRTCGIWSKNRWEWNTTFLACMACRSTAIGFYDAMAENSIEYITDLTELATIFMTPGYIKTLVEMRKKNKIPTLKTVVLFDPPLQEDEVALGKHGIRCLSFEEIMYQGRQSSVPLDWNEADPDDSIIFFFTSGTTGDPKGAKTTHETLLANSILSEDCLLTD